MMKLLGLVLISWVLCSTQIQAQSVWERLESWEQSINDEYAAINVDVLMRDAQNFDKILDKSEIQVVQDESGFYAKLFDFELFAEGDVGVTVDHQDKRIKVSSAESVKGQTKNMLRMSTLSALSQMVNISASESDNSISYKMHDKEEGKLILELEFELGSNKLIMMRQPIAKRIEVKERFYNAIVEMNYSYPVQEQRPLAAKYIAQQNGDWSCRPSFKSYELLAN